MYDSAKNSAEELREMVAYMEKMRVEAIKGKTAKFDPSWNYKIPTLMKNHSALDDWLQALKRGIQWHAYRPMRWAQSLLFTSNNAMILAFDTTYRLVITRIVVIDMHEKVLFDTYVKPEPAMVESDGRITGERDPDYSHPLPPTEVRAPTLAEAWALLRDIMKQAGSRYSPTIGVPPIVSYDLSLYKSIIPSHAHYCPELRRDYVWNNLLQINFIEEAMLYFWDDSVFEEERALEVFCQKIAYPLPPLAQQTADVRARAQLRVLEAMAQGIGAKDLFAEEE
jgi:hypothetical protein